MNGMALGFDTMCFHVLERLREEHDVKIIISSTFVCNFCRLVGGIKVVIQIADLDSLIVPGEHGS